MNTRKRWLQGLALWMCLAFLAGVIPSQSPTRAAAPALLAAGPSATPEEVGLSSVRLQRIADAIQKSVNDGRISGGVSLVARHGKIAYFQAVGMADRDARKPMRTDSIFRICSMSKPLTSVAVMMLYEEGRFALSDPVSDYLPEFKHMKVLDPPWPQDKTSPPGKLVDAKHPITIFQLLTHTSGLTYPWNPRVGKAYRDASVGSGIKQQEGTIGEAVKGLATIPLLFQPGEDWEYSLADDVLGRLVEVVSGMPFDKFLGERLFHPLGMEDTGFFPPQEKLSRLASAYAYDEKGLHPILDGQVMTEDGFQFTADYPYRGPHTYFSGGGGLCSTAEDYYRFCQMMLNGGELNGTRIISRKSVELMSHDHVQGKPDGPNAYGLGFGVNSDPIQLKELGSVGSYFWGGFYFTSFVIDPKEDLIAIFMGQLHPTGGLDLSTKAITLAYQAIKD